MKRSWFILTIGLLAAACTPPRDPRLIRAEQANDAVQALLDDGRFDRGLKEAQAAVERARKDLPADSPLLARAIYLLGQAFMNKEDLKASQTHLTEALALFEHAAAPPSALIAECLSYLGNLAVAQQRLAEAREAFERSLALREQLLSDDKSEVAESWVELAFLDQVEQKPTEAEALYKKALAMLEKRSAPEDLKLGRALFWYGYFLLNAGRLAESLAPLQRAYAVMGKHQRADHPELVEVMTGLAQAYQVAGKHVESRPILERLVAARAAAGDPRLAEAQASLAAACAFLDDQLCAIREYGAAVALLEKRYGPDAPQVAGILAHLADRHMAVAEYDKAEALFGRADRIFQTAYGPGNQGTAFCQQGLAKVHTARADYGRAWELYQQAMQTYERLLGPDDPQLGLVLNQAGGLLMLMGRVPEARRLFERAIDILTRAFGPDHPHLAQPRQFLADAYRRLGREDKAREQLERALAITERAFGEEHSQVAEILGQLAHLALLAGEWQACYDLYQRALAIQVRVNGNESVQVASSLNNLAHMMAMAEQYDHALELYEQAYLRFDKALGQDHPFVAQARANWALIKTFAGAPAEAQPVCERGLAGLAASVGDDSYLYAQNLRCLMLAHWTQGQTDAARADSARMIAIARERIDPLLGATSEEERLDLIRSRRAFLDDYLSLFDRAEDAAMAYAAVLGWKGVVANSLAAQRAAVLAAGEPELAILFTELGEVRRQLARLVFAAADPKKRDSAGAALVGLAERKEKLERTLAERSGAFKAQRSLLAAGPAEVCAQLGEGEALVDFLRYGHYSPPKGDQPSEGEREARYLAFVLKKGSCDKPRRVDLGQADAIERAVSAYRELISGRARASRLDRQGRLLRRLVWTPIAVALGEVKQVWLIPDGALSGLPFAALPDEEEHYLIEQTALGYLSSAQDLIRLAEPAPPGAGALVAGGVDYGPASTAAAAGERAAAPPTGLRQILRGVFPVGALPETKKEAERVARLLGQKKDPGVLLLTGAAASEQAVKELSANKRILHLASHGFFVAASPNQQQGAAAGRKPIQPMLLSGLLLAGANREPQAAQAEDGVLTAEEVSALDLRAAELVTLSACDTGLGRVEDGQGILGLRRAFAAAGARALVLSLWKVPDRETRTLMERFYRQLAREPRGSKAAAFQNAQLGVIRDQRKRLGETNPRTWAAFIVSGR